MSARTHIQTEKELCAAARPPRRFFRQNAKTFLTFVSFSDKIHLACGGIAQLGERLNGIQEVSGSIPLISTTKRDIRSDVSFHFKIEWNAESRRNGQLPADYEWRGR